MVLSVLLIGEKQNKKTYHELYTFVVEDGLSRVLVPL